MQSKEHRNYKLWLIAGLMVASTILFVVGVTLERSNESERPEAIAAPQESEAAHETQETGETHSEEAGEAHSEETDAHVEGSSEIQAEEANEAHAEEAAEVHSEEGGEAHSETIFGFDPGFNLESPWLVAVAALGSLALAAALLWFGQPILVIVIPVAIVMTLLDISEVMHQVSEGNIGLAILATIIGLMRATVAIMAIVALREWRTSLRQPTSSRQSVS